MTRRRKHTRTRWLGDFCDFDLPSRPSVLHNPPGGAVSATAIHHDISSIPLPSPDVSGFLQVPGFTPSTNRRRPVSTHDRSSDRVEGITHGNIALEEEQFSDKLSPFLRPGRELSWVVPSRFAKGTPPLQSPNTPFLSTSTRQPRRDSS